MRAGPRRYFNTARLRWYQNADARRVRCHDRAEVARGDRTHARHRAVRRRGARRAQRARRRGRQPARPGAPRPRPDPTNAARSPATGTTPRRSAAARSATSSACRSTTRSCTACRTTTCCATATCSAWTSRSASTAGSPTPPAPSSSAPPPTEDLRLIRATEEALEAGDRGRAAGQPARRHLGGDRGGRPPTTATRSTPSSAATGIGRTMHEAPHVPNKGRAGRGLKLRAGPDPRPRTLVRPHHRPDHLRPRRLDDPLGRRLAHGPLRAHRRHHRGRPPGAHPTPATPGGSEPRCGDDGVSVSARPRRSWVATTCRARSYIRQNPSTRRSPEGRRT